MSRKVTTALGAVRRVSPRLRAKREARRTSSYFDGAKKEAKSGGKAAWPTLTQIRVDELRVAIESKKVAVVAQKVQDR